MLEGASCLPWMALLVVARQRDDGEPCSGAAHPEATHTVQHFFRLSHRHRWAHQGGEQSQPMHATRHARAALAHLYLRRQQRGLLAQLRVLRPQRRLARRAPAPGVLRAPQDPVAELGALVLVYDTCFPQSPACRYVLVGQEPSAGREEGRTRANATRCPMTSCLFRVCARDCTVSWTQPGGAPPRPRLHAMVEVSK